MNAFERYMAGQKAEQSPQIPPGNAFERYMAAQEAGQNEQPKPKNAFERYMQSNPSPVDTTKGTWTEREGVFYDAYGRPRGEKGVEVPLYDPIDTTVDLMTGGGAALVRNAGKLGAKALAGEVAKSAAKDVAYGGLAGAAMSKVDDWTGNSLATMAAGIGSPLVTSLALTGARKGLARAADKYFSFSPELASLDTKSGLMQRYGTAAEQIGADTFGLLSHTDAEKALKAGAVESETAQYTLKPWLSKVLSSVPYLGPNMYGVNKAALYGVKLKNAVGKIPGLGNKIAKKLGIAPNELQKLSMIAESIPSNPLDKNGFLRLGLKDKDGNWRHGLDPAKAWQAVNDLTPQAKNLLMAFVEPANGYHVPPRLSPRGIQAGEGVIRGQWALDQVAAKMGMKPSDVATNYYAQGRNAFVSGFGGKDAAARQNAVDAANWLESRAGKNYSKQLRAQMPRPKNARVMGTIEQLPQPIMLHHPTRPPGQKPSTISREKAFEELVNAGVLDPAQHLQGYVTHMATGGNQTPEYAKLVEESPKLNLKEFIPGFSKTRSGTGGPGPLDEAVTAYRSAAEKAMIQNRMLKELGNMILTPVKPLTYIENGVEKPILRKINDVLQQVPKDPTADEIRRTVQEYSPWADKQITRQEPLTVVEVGPKEAEALGVKPWRYMIPKAMADRFDLLLGRIKSGRLDTPIDNLEDFVKDASRYWKANVLVAPGTVATNALGGATQYGGMVMEDLARGDLKSVAADIKAPFKALTPTAVKNIPPEILGQNIRNQFDDTSLFAGRVLDRMRAGEKVNMPLRTLARFDQALGAGLNLALAPFGLVENYWKRAIYLAKTEAWAKDEAKRMVQSGKITNDQKGAMAESLAATAFQKRPDIYKKVMQGPLDAFGMDYANIPTGLKKLRESTLGSLIFPFPVYTYKYGRMIGRQANAFNPFSHMPIKERVARGGGLVGSVGAPYLIREALAGPDSEVEEVNRRFKEEFPDAPAETIRYPYLGGREHIHSYTDEKGRPQEVFLRTAKYGYLNLPKAFKSQEDFVQFLDEFKSTGPIVPILANALEFVPRKFGAKDLGGQAGEMLSGFIPAHRMVEFIARVTDEFRKRSPKGFLEKIMVKIPGLRHLVHQPVDKWAVQLAQQNAGEEWLKFLSGINLKTVDVVGAKEAVNEAVMRASDQLLKDEQRIIIYSRHSGLPAETIKDNLDRIKRAEAGGLLKQREAEQQIFYQALNAGMDVLDPGQAEAITKFKRKIGGKALAQSMGLYRTNQARAAARLIAGLGWIQENLNNNK